MPNTSEEIYCIVGEEDEHGIKREHVFLQTKDAVPIDDNLRAGPLLAKKRQGGGKKYEYLQITRTEAFILRLLLQQLDVPLIELAVIMKCSDKLTVKEAHALVQKVINRYKQQGFIQPMTEAEIKKWKIKIPRLEMLADKINPPQDFDKLHLNATINQIGPPIFMISFPPLQ
jgi:hypothetical protein